MGKIFRDNLGADIRHQPTKREKQAPPISVENTQVKKCAWWQSFYAA